VHLVGGHVQDKLANICFFSFTLAASCSCKLHVVVIVSVVAVVVAHRFYFLFKQKLHLNCFAARRDVKVNNLTLTFRQVHWPERLERCTHYDVAFVAKTRLVATIGDCN